MYYILLKNLLIQNLFLKDLSPWGRRVGLICPLMKNVGFEMYGTTTWKKSLKPSEMLFKNTITLPWTQNSLELLLDQ